MEPGDPPITDRAGGVKDAGGTASTGRLVLAVGRYVGLRALLVAVPTVVLVWLGLPATLALIIAIVLALPLSMVLFRSSRARASAEIDEARRERRERRERLRAELRGES